MQKYTDFIHTYMRAEFLASGYDAIDLQIRREAEQIRQQLRMYHGQNPPGSGQTAPGWTRLV